MPISTVGILEAVFDAVAQAIRERVISSPGPEAVAELRIPEGLSPPNRWQLRTIRASVPAVKDYSLSGVWYACQRAKVRLRVARPQLYSPDADYTDKRDRILAILREMAADPVHVVVLFLDEMGYMRWPEGAPTFAPASPIPAPTTTPSGTEIHHRVAGMLDAFSGRVTAVDHRVVGTERLLMLYRRLPKLYPQATRIYVVQDNWSVHAHATITAFLETVPQIEQVWLPLAAYWLNPIEKLWRKLRQEVLRLHQLAAEPMDLRLTVRTYLRQFEQDSEDLLRYVGLLGDGPLACARRGDRSIGDL